MLIDNKTTMEKNEYKRAARVTLIDAVDLDSETHSILKDQLLKATKFLSADFLVRWEAEMDAILRFGIWRLSVCKHHATFGQQLLRVKYGDDFTKRKAQLFVILTVGCSYIKQKISKLSLTADEPQSNLLGVKKVLAMVEVFVLVASLLNLIVFLRNGVYPTLIDRVLRLRPISVATPGTSRVVGYQYMTRELLWHGFIELITFTVPLVNYRFIKDSISRWLFRKTGDKRQTFKRGDYGPAVRCADCNEVPVLPHHIGCCHTFCYYCLQLRKTGDTFNCSKCGHQAIDIISLSYSEARPIGFH